MQRRNEGEVPPVRGERLRVGTDALHGSVEGFLASVPPMDAHLLAALESGMPACAGVALGVDRLLMAMLQTSRIADVLAFDFARA